jgi:hypothetical protein
MLQHKENVVHKLVQKYLFCVKFLICNTLFLYKVKSHGRRKFK